MVVHGTSFTIPIVALRYHEGFRKVYYTKGNNPLRLGPVLENLPADVKFLVVEFPEYYVRRFAEVLIPPSCQ